MPISNTIRNALERHPRTSLLRGPTSLDRAPRLGKHLGIDLYIKRDDCDNLALGGNKVRQLEYYLGEALAERADTVLITGAVQSNFVRLTAGAARRLGLDVHVQLEDRVSNPDPAYQHSGNVLLNRLLGATIHRFPVGNDEAAADANLEAIAEGLAERGARPYVIHLGIDHPPLGSLGYVRAAQELVRETAELGIDLNQVIVASGSGLTHAGLLIGLRAEQCHAIVQGVCVRRPAAAQEQRMRRRAQEVAALLDADALSQPSDVHLTDAVLAPGYGELSQAVMEAITTTAHLEGLLLDPVYTGKAMAGLFHLVQTGVVAKGAAVVFVHTGGIPALFGYQGALTPLLSDGG